MTVKELIEQLQKMPQDSIVIIQKDGEGNDYSPLDGAYDENVYIADSTWSGMVYNNDEQPDEDADEEEDYLEYDPADAVPCVVLTPVN